MFDFSDFDLASVCGSGSYANYDVGNENNVFVFEENDIGGSADGSLKTSYLTTSRSEVSIAKGPIVAPGN